MRGEWWCGDEGSCRCMRGGGGGGARAAALLCTRGAPVRLGFRRSLAARSVLAPGVPATWSAPTGDTPLFTRTPLIKP